jgi:hypothetical protein
LSSALRLGSAVVVNTGFSSVVSETVVVEVDLSNTLLEHGYDVSKGAEAIKINRTDGMGFRDGNNGVVSIRISHVMRELKWGLGDLHDEANLPGRLVCRALQDLSGEVGPEGHKLACYESVAPLVTRGAQGQPIE